ncbi:MAG: type II toxin-antitoxin system RelE/ParE family toxin [Pseudomonadota bacterium]
MRLEFLPEAEADLDRLFIFLVEKNPLAAQKAMLAIDEALNILLESPLIGHVPEHFPDYRQHIVTFGKSGYIVRYRIQEDALIVTRIWAGRERR